MQDFHLFVLLVTLDSCFYASICELSTTYNKLCCTMYNNIQNPNPTSEPAIERQV